MDAQERAVQAVVMDDVSAMQNTYASLNRKPPIDFSSCRSTNTRALTPPAFFAAFLLSDKAAALRRKGET
jgi:hypothetical protein